MPRRRRGSVAEIIDGIEHDPAHHLVGPFNPSLTPVDTPPTPKVDLPPSQKTPTSLSVRPSKTVIGESLWDDIKTMNWIRSPASSFKLMLVPLVLFLNWHVVSPEAHNPFKYFITIQYRVPDSADDDPRYQKGYGDLAFLFYYVIVFTFIRQTITIHFFRPLALRLGIRREAKIDRFAEQGYAIAYFSVFGSAGIWAMSNMDTWYYNTKNFWTDYPYWAMTPTVKTYYLLQFAYWTQQLLILALKLEKPRKDFNELVIHHLVTIWLIGWSYLFNLTKIGNAVFITMDISDMFFAFAKTLNYLKLENASAVAFSWFVFVWSYGRHYLNIKILYSVWTEWDLIPEAAKVWNPEQGVWMVWWMKWQIFVPLFLLQLVNLFWYFLIWRVLIRAVFGTKLEDERSDDEDDGKPDEPEDDKKD
ncbi:hypothetical protein FRC02_008856 [Tulasnella sp. 418]|nr:hypothetical protein FRC02_008856 [Tulasnella sp. 418]